ncbi:hypothetical protein MASR2M29_05040 [Spirochaetota bacterium]
MDCQIPNKDSELSAFTSKLIELCKANKLAWDIPPDAVNTLEAMFTVYENALRATQPAIRKSDIVIKTEAKEVLSTLLKSFIKKNFEQNPAAKGLSKEGIIAACLKQEE